MPSPARQPVLGSPVSHRGGGASVRSPTVHAVSGSFTRRSPATRQLLERASDVIDRHFIHAHLEALLYQSRDASASALDEYDAACRQHDSEMDGIRAAFIAKWGQVPCWRPYKQMTIRQQKAKNFEQALSWGERAIAVNGDDCARPEAVEDLRKRADSFQARLQPRPRPSGSRISKPHQPEIETLVCVTCEQEFQRTRIRGRKPLHCPQSRSLVE
jgi:hypothetical protein